MYAGRVACCPLVSHGEYADGTDRRTDRRMDARHDTLLLLPIMPGRALELCVEGDGHAQATVHYTCVFICIDR